MSQINPHLFYRLKEGAEPTCGRPIYGAENLEVLTCDFEDGTVEVRPEGFSSGAFWANHYDLEVH